MTVNTLATAPAQQTRTPGPVEETLRLAQWNLYLAWHRSMTKVLLSVLLAAYVVLVLLALLVYAVAGGTGVDLVTLRNSIVFPLSLAQVGVVMHYIAPALGAILAGTLIGSEYAYGTHRLSLARGNSRAQVLGGQVLSLALLAMITSAAMLALGLLVGVALAPLLGGDLVIPYPDGWAQIALYWLALSLNVWGYMLVALFF